MRLAHLSDLHFAHFTLNPLQLFSKRLLGNFNYFFARQREFSPKRLHTLPSLFKHLGLSHVLITGDLTTTSLKKEFESAASFVEALKTEGLTVFTLPGNHDQYTTGAFKKQRFYDYFPSDLKKDKIAVRCLKDNWWLILLDTAIATRWLSCHGRFSEEIESKLRTILSAIPKDHHVMIANHFPLFENHGSRKSLERAEALQQVMLDFSQINLYLHGHNHHLCIADLRKNHFPIVIDSGSASHGERGSWNLLDLGHHSCQLQTYRWDPSSASSWTPHKEPSSYALV